MNNLNLAEAYTRIRNRTEEICRPLQTEDYVVQPIADVSPPKWHIGHTTWFFETFILKAFATGYKEFNEQYGFVFNSYYESIGARVIRTDRGNLSRPSVEQVYEYRRYVNQHMHLFLNTADLNPDVRELLTLGLNHEQQHQELLLTDIKYILGHNPLVPAYSGEQTETGTTEVAGAFIAVSEGVYQIGFEGEGFSFDNELGRHKVYLNAFQIAAGLVTNGEYLDFMLAGGYEDFRYWHADGWEWVKQRTSKAPLYWHQVDGKWMTYTLSGLQELNVQDAVCHVNFYEASAYAAWKGKRLPTESEWEVAAARFNWGKRWEWTNSAYLPYPGYLRAEGAVGEYNGKFMVNQMVLRGASVATPIGHSRVTYRNFFQPLHQWQFTGIRLAD